MWSTTAATLIDDDGWRGVLRCPPEVLELAGSDVLREVSMQPAGVRFRFHPDGSVLSVHIRTNDPIIPLDLVVDGTLRDRRYLPAGESEQCFPLPDGDVAELWLPQGCVASTRDITVDGRPPHSLPFPSKRWIAYGSSITRARSAHGPSQTWPALVADRFGLDNESIGMAGECHLDPGIADYIAESRPDYATLCLGINVYGAASYSARSWTPSVGGIIERVARSVPHVLVIGPVACPAREDQPNAVGVTLADLRDGVQRAATIIGRRHASVSYLDGRTLLGADESHLLMVDGVHPTSDGYLAIAQRLGDHFAELWFDGSSTTSGQPAQNGHR